jgi:hypothetical protein
MGVEMTGETAKILLLFLMFGVLEIAIHIPETGKVWRWKSLDGATQWRWSAVTFVDHALQPVLLIPRSHKRRALR